MAGPATEINSTALPGLWGALRPLVAERDARDIYAGTHGAEIIATWEEMKVGPFPNEDAFASHVEELLADRQRAFFAVVNADDLAQGWMCLMEASAAHKSIELGYVLYASTLQRTTLATEAFYLVMAHVFDRLGFQRLEWTCTAQNLRSRRAADRLGFTFEGIMRSKLILKGVTRDIALYSMLAEEWPERRAAMQSWLDKSNFENGIQRRPLALRMR